MGKIKRAAHSVSLTHVLGKMETPLKRTKIHTLSINSFIHIPHGKYRTHLPKRAQPNKLCDLTEMCTTNEKKRRSR
jgi:hypothetical protein